MSEFISICPKCRQQILCDTAYVGKRVACPMCLQEITMPNPPSQSAQSGQAPAQGTPSAPASKKSPVAMIAIIGGVVVVLAAGAAFFVLHKPSQTTPPAPTASRTPATPAPVATPTPAPPATPAPETHPAPPPETRPAPVAQPAPKVPENLSQPLPAGVFEQSVGHYILNANGYSEIFAVDSHGNLVHKSNTGAGSAWGSWSKVSTTDGYVGHPAVYSGPEGAVDVFVLNGSDHTIAHFNRVNFSSTWNESSLGGDLGSDPAVVMNENQYMEVFAVGQDGVLTHNWSTDAGNSWNGWVTMGVNEKGSPAVVIRSDGGVEVFVRRGDNSLDHYAHPRFSAKWQATTLYGGGFASNPWAVQASDSHVEAFCIKSNGTLWHNANRGTGTTWGGWSQLDTGIPLLTSELFAAVTKNGDTIVYGCQATDSLVGFIMDTPNGWGNWGLLGSGAQ